MKASRSLAPLVVALGLSALACGDSNTDDPIPQRFQAFAQAVEQERAAMGNPGIAVAVVEKGVVTFAHGFGQKDPSRPAPVQPTTLFRIGSCTKMLTAIGLLQNVQAGKIGLDDPIPSDVPAFHLNKTPTALAGVEIRHLLSHSGGLSDYLETNAPADEQTDTALEQFLTGRFADIGYIASPPGALWTYANPDYMLAGLIAEKTSGVPYRSLMRDNVFVPLGMNRTFFLPSEVLADGDYAVGTNCATPDQGHCLSPEVGPVIQPQIRKAGVLVSPGSFYFSKAPKDFCFRLSLANVSPDKIHEGCRRLGNVLKGWV
jgi:CubicO group peptidase (beta-lactamase class C family)